MKKRLMLLIFAGILFFGMGGMAGAVTFTLNSYDVSVWTDTNNGLSLNTTKILAEPTSWDLNVGDEVEFDLFRVWTTEGSSDIDDWTNRPINVSFNWTAPPATVPDSLNGVSFGWILWIPVGEVQWADSPAVFNFGTGGQFTLALEGATFPLPGGADIEATLKYVSASTGSDPIPGVPEPATLILLGAGLLGLAAIRRKK